MVMPGACPTFKEALRSGSEIFHALNKRLAADGHNTNVGDEGGFAPDMKSADEALGAIMKAIEAAGYKPGEDVMIALDPASTEFFKDGKYVLEGEGRSEEHTSELQSLMSISYAVFCLKKKKKHTTEWTTH